MMEPRVNERPPNANPWNWTKTGTILALSTGFARATFHSSTEGFDVWLWYFFPITIFALIIAIPITVFIDRRAHKKAQLLPPLPEEHQEQQQARSG